MILLDTQCLVWLVSQPGRLSRSARRAIVRGAPRSGLAIASVTLRELAQLAASGHVRRGATPTAWLRQLLVETPLGVRQITPDVAAVAAFLPPGFPVDPFDRLIAATAIVDRIPLVAADARIRESGAVEAIW